MVSRFALGGVLVAVVVLVLVAPAWGHAFQVQHTPAQGERLASSPRDVALQLSEPVVRTSVELGLRDVEDRPVRVGEAVLASEGRVLRVPVPPLDDGVYVVSWQVESAADGHLTAGEFAFAVGDAAGDVPLARQSAPLAPVAVASSWLLLAGLSLGGGALLMERVLALADAQRRLLVVVARVGLLAAAVGALARLASLRLGAVSDSAAFSRPALLTTGVVAALAVAMTLAGLGRARWWSLAVTVTAAALWSGQGHAAAFRGGLGAVVDFAHVVTAGGWAGSLATIVVLLWHGHRDKNAALPQLVAGYARLALWLAVVAVLTGTVSALGLLDGLRSLWETGYGITLLVKVGLVGVAVGAAVLARVSGLPQARLGLLRRSASAEVGLLGLVLVATALLASLGPPVGANAAETLLGPPPLSGPVARTAGLAGSLNVEVVAGADRLQVQVFTPSGPVDGTQVAVEVDPLSGASVTLRPRPCGAGCVTQELTLRPGATEVAVDAGAPGWTGGRFTGRLSWPPSPPQPELLRQLVDRMRAVPQLVMTEEVSSGPGVHTRPTTIALSGTRFVELAPYAGGEAVDVRRVTGEPSAIELTLPAARIWVTIRLDEQGRLARERIVSPGHVIDRTFAYDNRGVDAQS